MSELKKHIDTFLERGTRHRQKKQEEALAAIEKKLDALNDSIITQKCSAALSSWESGISTSSFSALPEYLRYGMLKMVDSNGQVMSHFSIPLLLPTKVNAVMIDLHDDSVKVPNIFQSIIIRLLMSLKMNLVKVSIVDMNFGRSFPVVSSITNPMFKCQIIDQQEEVSQLIAGLAKEISKANRTILGRYPNIDQYNANLGEMAYPYHFVFIDDFPKGFTSQALDDLLRLIENGNASGAGIKIFINYSAKNTATKDFNIKEFKYFCSRISRPKKTANRGAQLLPALLSAVKMHKEIYGSDSNGARDRVVRYTDTYSSITDSLNEDKRFVLGNWPIHLPPNVVPIIDLELPVNYRDLVNTINGVKQEEDNCSLDGWIEGLINARKVWTGNTSDGIKVPVGFVSPTKTFDFYLANDNDSNCKDFFALVAGRSGSGKTVLLHNLIVNAAMMYSPKELQFYLADFSNGTSFVNYQNLPHVQSLMLSNNKEYALRMIEQLLRESKRRATLYKKAKLKYGVSIETLASYRQTTGDVLPRILFIIDEVQVLYLSNDLVTTKAREALIQGIRDWRKYGISVILCSQSFIGLNLGNAESQITYRFAFNLTEEDSQRVIRNGSAKELPSSKHAIMNNTSDGRLDMNQRFQTAYSQHYIEYVKYLADLYEKRFGEKHIPFICEAETEADIAENHELSVSIKDGKFEINHQYCDVFVGKPDLLRDKHTRIRYQRRQNSNTLIVGYDYKTMIYDIMVQLIQLQGCSHPNSKMIIADCFNIGNEYQGYLNGIQTISKVFTVANSKNIETYLDEFCAELERRKEEQKDKMTEERWVLAIMNAQDCYALKPQPDKYGRTESSEAAKKLSTLLAEGSTLGMHCIVHCQSYNTMFKNTPILSSREFSMFENLILLKGADVSNMYLDNLKVAAPEEEGIMIVMNGKIDNEAYEQCKVYSDFTIDGDGNPTIDFMTNLFIEHRDD